MKHRFKIKKVEETTSTNSLMQELLKAGKLNNGDVIRANYQSRGIGQVGNLWESEKGKNLTFSLFLDTHFLAASEVFYLNKVISIAIHNYLTDLDFMDVKIKWPNDIYIGNKKVAGMLTNNSFLGNNLQNSIIGVGLNVNQVEFLKNAPNPTSLKLVSQKNYDLDEELDKLLQYIYQHINQLAKGDVLQIDADYLDRLYQYKEQHKYKDRSGTFSGEIIGVDAYGQLRIEKINGEQLTFGIKEVEFL